MPITNDIVIVAIGIVLNLSFIFLQEKVSIVQKY